MIVIILYLCSQMEYFMAVNDADKVVGEMNFYWERGANIWLQNR